jgi:hypothetical protein
VEETFLLCPRCVGKTDEYHAKRSEQAKKPLA